MSLARKIHYKALHRPLIRISELRREREGERFLRSQPELWRLLSAYCEASESVGCSYADYAYLFRRLREYRYREVLECGTGASTVVLAYAAMLNTRDGSPCQITSLDSIKPWYESACKFFPDELRDCASIHYSDVVPSGFSIYRGVRYASLPENVWTQQWNVGDVVIWDNRRVLHRRDAFPNDMRRMMRRCQVLARESLEST